MKKPRGICKICGKEDYLTYEHVPPKGAFNSGKSETIRGDAFTSVISGDRLPWDTEGLRKDISQNGWKMLTLCKRCNNFTGRKYVPEYLKWVYGIYNFLGTEKIELDKKYPLKTSLFKPLNVLKEIIVMFCSNTALAQNDKEVKDFLLDPENKNFPKSKYRVYMNMFAGGVAKNTGVIATFTTKGVFTSAQITYAPLDLTLLFDNREDTNYDIFGTDITDWADYDYNEEVELSIEMKVITSFLPLPQDKTSYKEVVLKHKKSKK